MSRRRSSARSVDIRRISLRASAFSSFLPLAGRFGAGYGQTAPAPFRMHKILFPPDRRQELASFRPILCIRGNSLVSRGMMPELPKDRLIALALITAVAAL